MSAARLFLRRIPAPAALFAALAALACAPALAADATGGPLWAQRAVDALWLLATLYPLWVLPACFLVARRVVRRMLARSTKTPVPGAIAAQLLLFSPIAAVMPGDDTAYLVPWWISLLGEVDTRLALGSLIVMPLLSIPVATVIAIRALRAEDS